MVVGFQIGSGVNAVFGCVDGGGWVEVSILVVLQPLLNFIVIKSRVSL